MKKKNSINKDGNPPWNLTLLALWQKLVWLVNMLRVRVGIYRGKGDKTVLKQSKRRDCSNCQAPTSTNIKKKRKREMFKKSRLLRTVPPTPRDRFLQGEKRTSHLYIYLQLIRFVRHVQCIKLGHAHARTSYHIKWRKQKKIESKNKRGWCFCCIHKQGPYTLNQIEMSQSRPLALPPVPARGHPRSSEAPPPAARTPSPRAGRRGGEKKKKKKKSTLYKYHHKRRAPLSPKVRRRGQN